MSEALRPAERSLPHPVSRCRPARSRRPARLGMIEDRKWRGEIGSLTGPSKFGIRAVECAFCLEPIPVGRTKLMTMHGELERGVRRPPGWPRNDERRSPSLSGTSGTTHPCWDSFLVLSHARLKKGTGEFAAVGYTEWKKASHPDTRNFWCRCGTPGNTPRRKPGLAKRVD